MGNIDSAPILSQTKSLVQVIGGDAEGARQTQENFSRRCAGVSQLRSLGEAIGGDPESARRTQEEFAQNQPVVRTIYRAAKGEEAGGIGLALAGDIVALTPGLNLAAAVAEEICVAAIPLLQKRKKIQEWFTGVPTLLLAGPEPRFEYSCSLAEVFLSNRRCAVQTFSDGNGERHVESFLRNTSGGKRFIYYNGHGGSDGTWYCNGSGHPLRVRRLRELVEQYGGAGSTGIAADCCYAGKTVEELSSCAFVIGSSRSDQLSYGMFARWLFSDCDAVPPHHSTVTVAGHIF